MHVLYNPELSLNALFKNWLCSLAINCRGMLWKYCNFLLLKNACEFSCLCLSLCLSLLAEEVSSCSIALFASIKLVSVAAFPTFIRQPNYDHEKCYVSKYQMSNIFVGFLVKLLPFFPVVVLPGLAETTLTWLGWVNAFKPLSRHLIDSCLLFYRDSWLHISGIWGRKVPSR